MCLMKIWLPSFSPYSVLSKGKKNNNKIREKYILHQDKERLQGLTICQFLLHQRRLNGFVWDVLMGKPLVA